MKRTLRVKSSLLWFLIASLTVCLVGGEREEYDPRWRPQGPHRPPVSPSPYGSHLSQLLDDPDLWLILRKRFGGGGGGGGVDSALCSADTRRNNTIIKTKDSLDAGAAFISSTSVTNDKDCEKECCKTSACSTAVVNLKDSKNGQNEGIACYLFDCKSPSVCVFTSHLGFIVLEFDSKISADHHAEELDRLASSGVNLSSVAATTSTTTPSNATAAAKAGQKENGARKNVVGLFGECHRLSDCRDQNTGCLSGYCICRQGFHVVEMQCRKDCNQELEFECSNKNSALFSECIAVYDYCDGIVQCTDGSDETSSCLDSSKHRGGSQSGGRIRNRARPQPPHVNNSTVAVPTESDVVSPKNNPSAVPVNSATTAIPPESTSLNDRATTSGKVKVSPMRHRLPSVDHKHTLAQDVGDDVKQEKVERYFWQMETNRGAVTALALGIILTTALVILAGCRLRHFRKRYRKGRHLTSNEADYLINGMYL